MSPSYNHSYLAHRIGNFLGRDEKYNIHIELTIAIDGVDFVPDLAVYPRKAMDFLHDKIKMEELPIMVVEILSPTQGVNEITDKFEIYLKAGIKSCWLVIPPTQTIVVFNDIKQPQSYSQGELQDVAVGIRLKVGEIFK